MSKLTAWGGCGIRSNADAVHRSPRNLFAALFYLLVAGCSGDAGVTGLSGEESSPDLSSAEIEVVSGGGQEGVVGATLPDPLTVEVSDAAGVPVPGVSVQWTFTAGRGAPSANAAAEERAQIIVTEADVEGRTEVWWELGTRPGVQIVTARLLDANGAPAGPAGAPGGNGKGKAIGLTANARTGAVSEVDVTPGEASVDVQDSLRLEAVVSDAYGNAIEGASVTWRTSDEAVATVDETGLVEPASPGTVVVTAESDGVEGAASITTAAGGTGSGPLRVGDLSVASVSSTSVTLRWTAVDDGTGSGADYAVRIGSPSISWGDAGASQVLAGGIEIGQTYEYVWPSLDPATRYEVQLVAYRGSFVDGTVVFSELSNTASGVTETSTGGPTLDVARVMASPDTVRFSAVGETRDLTVTAEDSDGQAVEGLTYEFVSSNSSIVEVDAMGGLTARGLGTALIAVSALCCDAADSTVVIVEESSQEADAQPGTLEVTPSSSVITGVGSTSQLEVAARDSLGNVISPDVTWESLDPSVATVNRSGLVTAQAVGTALIVAGGSCCTGDTAQISVENPISADGLLLQSDWSTATGNSLEAVSDGGKGVVRWCNWDNVLSVEPGSAVGWTGTSNVLAIRSINSCGHVEFENVFPRPTDGEEQFWAVRYYVMNGEGQTDSKMHPHTFWPVGSIEAVHSGISHVGNNGDWHMRSGWGRGESTHSESTTGGPLFPWFPMDGTSRRVLSKDTWYRYEFIMHWLNATEYRVYPRLYDMAGNLLNDETNWQHSDGAGTMAEWYAAGNAFTRKRNSSDPDNIRTFSFGMGQSGSSGGYYYIADAAFALVSGSSAFIGRAEW